jgi:hypothetical protein
MKLNQVVTDVVIDKEFLKSLPMSGTVEFDYVR